MDYRLEPQAQQPDYWGQLTTGVSNGLWNSTIGIAEYFCRPQKFVETAEGLYFVATNLRQSASAVANAFYEQPVKEIAELATGILVGRVIGHVISYATKSVKVEQVRTVVDKYVTTVVQKMVLTEEAIKKLNELTELVKYFTDLEKIAPKNFNLREVAEKAQKLKKLILSINTTTDSHFARFFHHLKKAADAYLTDPNKLINRLSRAGNHVKVIGVNCSNAIEAAGSQIIEVATTTCIPTEIITNVSREVLLVSPEIASNIANAGFLTQNLSRIDYHQNLEYQFLEQLPVRQEAINQPLLEQQFPVEQEAINQPLLEQQQFPVEQEAINQPLLEKPQPLKKKRKHLSNSQKFTNLKTVVEQYTLGAPRKKSGMLPSSLSEINQILKGLQIGETDFNHKITKIVNISKTMGNHHPITAAAGNCLFMNLA